MQHEVMECDVLIIGAGPAGLSAAIRLGQLAKEAGTRSSSEAVAQTKPLNIMVLEKGANVGAHILSGCVFEPRALDELIPDWQEKGAPIKTAVTSEKMRWLTKSGSFSLPTPGMMHNKGNYIISLGRLCQWLAEEAEALGVQIMPGFPIAEPWIEDGKLVGGITGAFGLDKDGKETANYQPPIAIKAKYTLVGEGCRGSVAEELIKEFDLRADSEHQTYGLGLKEIWQIDEDKHKPGHVEHMVGWPLNSDTYGGGFIYHAENNQVYLGYVVGLDYENPLLDPFAQFQKFKTHPLVDKLLANGKCISYGARALNEGGIQSVPKLTFPGGAIIGCSAGFLNVPKIKGTHTAMKSGMLAAEAVFAALQDNREGDELDAYGSAIKQSWIYKELKAARNIRPSFKWGRFVGMLYSGIDMMLLGGKAPWTLKHGKADHLALLPTPPAGGARGRHSNTPNGSNDIEPYSTHEIKPHITNNSASGSCPYPTPPASGVGDYGNQDKSETVFDRPSSLYLSGTNHTEGQPAHLKLKDAKVAIEVNWQQYGSPEQYYCPAGVYEISERDGTAELLIHAQNCLHCKTCDIKDPTQNIKWTTPEGGGGPNYQNM